MKRNNDGKALEYGSSRSRCEKEENSISGFPKSWGTFLGPCNHNLSILGPILGSPSFWNLPYSGLYYWGALFMKTTIYS